MKILIVRSFPGYVDVSKATYNIQGVGLAKALNRRGNICDVVYCTDKERKAVQVEYAPGKYFNAYYLKSLNVLKNAIYFGLVELAKEYDIVYCSEYDQLQSWILAKKIPEKLIVYHGTYYSDFNVRYNKKCKIFDKIFLLRYIKNDIYFDTKSQLSADFLTGKGIKRTNAIGVGIDLERLQAGKMISSDLSEKMREIKNAGNNIVTYIGKIEPRRSSLFLMDVFAKILCKNPKTKFVLIGKGTEEYKDKTFSKMIELGLESSVIYVESVGQEYLPAIYSLSDAFLLPTHYEIFGMVLLEAMYFGAPVITTYNGGSEMLIEDGKSGTIIKEFDVDKWVDATLKILNDEGFSKEICKNAKEKIENEFTWDALSMKFIESFEKKLSDERNKKV